MVILLRYTSAFSEVIYANFYAKILVWNFRLVDENSQILVVESQLQASAVLRLWPKVIVTFRSIPKGR